MRSQPNYLTALAFAAVVLIGGTNFVAVRFSNRELPPFWGAGIRFTAAALLLLVIVVLQRLPLPRGRALLGAIIYGLLGFGAAYAFAYWGLKRVPAGLAAVVLASTPLFAFLLAIAHGQETFRWRALAGGMVALSGIAIMFGGSVSADVPLPSLLAMAATAVVFAESTVIVKQFPKTHPVTTNAVAMAVGAAVLILLSVVLGESRIVPVLPSTWIALAYLVLLGSSAVFVLFLFVLKQWTASAVSYQFVLFPIVAVVVAAVLEQAPVASSLAIGGGLVLSGVFVGAVVQPPPAEGRPKLGSEPCLTCPE